MLYLCLAALASTFAVAFAWPGGVTVACFLVAALVTAAFLFARADEEDLGVSFIADLSPEERAEVIRRVRDE